jgi:type IV secretion system protein TrbJ
MQALQVGHAIANQQVSQMQKLRGLISQQTVMMGTWYQSQQSQSDLAHARRAQFFSATLPALEGREMQILR